MYKIRHLTLFSAYHLSMIFLHRQNSGPDCTAIDYCPPSLRRTTCHLVQTMMFTAAEEKILAVSKHFPLIQGYSIVAAHC